MSTTNPSESDIKAAVKNIAENKPQQWVRCPACRDEWSKLKACLVGKDWNHICVQCAEHLSNWAWVVNTYPITKPFDNWDNDWVESESYFPKDVPKFAMVGKEKVPLTSNLRAYVNAWMGKREGNPHIRWWLMKENMSIVLWKEKEFLAKYDSTLAAWDDIKARLLKWAAGAEKAEATVKESWNGNLNFKRTR